MKPAPFSYLAPENLQEALGLLTTHGDGAKALAGGQSLMPMMNFRLARPDYLIDLNRLPELRRLEQVDGLLVVGSMVRQATIELSLLVKEQLPLLPKAISFIGHPTIRHRGTIGGSLAHADPAAELPALAVALDVEFVARRLGEHRSIPAEAFFLDYFTTPLLADELLCEVRIPIPGPGTGWSFLELSRRHGDFAIAGVVVLLGLDSDGAIGRVRIAFFGLGPVPIRPRRAEEMLVGRPPGEQIFAEAAMRAARETTPSSDIHASAEYRQHLAGVLCRRALHEAWERTNEDTAQ